LHPPCEITVKVLLPAIRTLVAKELSESYGWTQTKIARKLGVTQAAISGYLTQDLATAESLFSLEGLKGISSSVASGIVLKKMTQADLTNNLCEICLSMRRGGAICQAHRASIPELEDEKCAICMQLHRGISDVVDVRRVILGDLRSAVSMLESAPEFYAIVPEVSTDIVMGMKDAKGVADIAGIPGRLVKVRGRVRALMDPEFGVSDRLAKLLLAVMAEGKSGKSIRAAMNVKYDPGVLRAIEKLGLRYRSLRRSPDAKAEAEELTAFAGRAVRDSAGGLDVIIDEGGFGIEPNAYFLDETATGLAEKALRVAKIAGAAGGAG